MDDLITRLANVENADPHLADLMDEAIKALESMRWVSVDTPPTKDGIYWTFFDDSTIPTQRMTQLWAGIHRFIPGTTHYYGPLPPQPDTEVI